MRWRQGLVSPLRAHVLRTGGHSDLAARPRLQRALRLDRPMHSWAPSRATAPCQPVPGPGSQGHTFERCPCCLRGLQASTPPTPHAFLLLPWPLSLSTPLPRPGDLVPAGPERPAIICPPLPPAAPLALPARPPLGPQVPEQAAAVAWVPSGPSSHPLFSKLLLGCSETHTKCCPFQAASRPSERKAPRLQDSAGHLPSPHAVTRSGPGHPVTTPAPQGEACARSGSPHSGSGARAACWSRWGQQLLPSSQVPGPQGGRAGHRAHLVRPHSTVAALVASCVWEATGSIVSVLSSTAARTSTESCGRGQGQVRRVWAGRWTHWTSATHPPATLPRAWRSPGRGPHPRGTPCPGMGRPCPAWALPSRPGTLQTALCPPGGSEAGRWSGTQGCQWPAGLCPAMGSSHIQGRGTKSACCTFSVPCTKGSQTQVQGPTRTLMASSRAPTGWGQAQVSVHEGDACLSRRMQGACVGGPLQAVTCRAKERQAAEAVGAGSPGGGGQAGS